MPPVNLGMTLESGTDWVMITWHTAPPQPSTYTHTHHEMLEEPRTHDIGGVLRQDSSFVLGFLILIVQEGGEVKINLQGA